MQKVNGKLVNESPFETHIYAGLLLTPKFAFTYPLWKQSRSTETSAQ